MDVVIDTSALIAVIVGEPERNRIVEFTMLIRLAHTARRGSLPSCTTDSGARLGCPQMQRETADAQN
ncbi:MAG: type II toxin-antitoxin system VapC family toxin [Desulfobacterales bacterium]|nr:type II toxin-antitoxin system VapC family toxin [Desulfobacterales bacterium]